MAINIFNMIIYFYMFFYKLVDSSPGSNGFSSAFYRNWWEIIKDNVVEAAAEFFAGKAMPRFYSSSYIVLIPKMENPTGFYNLDQLVFAIWLAFLFFIFLQK